MSWFLAHLKNQIMNEHRVPHSDITELFPLAGNFLREHLPPAFLRAAGKTAEKGDSRLSMGVSEDKIFQKK